MWVTIKYILTLLSNALQHEAPTLFTASWLTKSKTCSAENSQPSWPDFMLGASYLKKFTT